MGKTILVGVAVWVGAVLVFAVVWPDDSPIASVAAVAIAVVWAVMWRRGQSQRGRTVESNGRHRT